MRSLVKRGIVAGAMTLTLLMGGAASGAALVPQQSAAAALSQAPMAEKEVIELIKHNKKDLAKITPLLQSRGLDFEITPETEKALRKAGATDDLMADLQKLTPSARAAAAKTTGGEVAPAVSPEERNAYRAVINELDPDRQIQLATDFAQKYPKSQWLTFVYSMEANAYQEKGDSNRAVDLAEKSLQLKPDNLVSLMVAASNLSSPQVVESLSDAQKAQKLNEAEQDANRALQIIDQAPKQPNEADAAYQKRKQAAESGAYSALGMVHLQRAEMGLAGPDKGELAKAEQDYNSAIQDAQSPFAPDYFRLGEVLSTEGKVDDAIAAFTKAGNAAPGTRIQTLAQQEIDKLKQQKAAAGPSKTQ